MENLINTGKYSALISFIIGTILLSIHLTLQKQIDVLYIGFIYTIGAFFVNLVILLILLFSAIIHHNHRFELMKISGILLLNIPITILYIYIVFNNLVIF